MPLSASANALPPYDIRSRRLHPPIRSGAVFAAPKPLIPIQPRDE